jgi:hypothetical protein
MTRNVANVRLIVFLSVVLCGVVWIFAVCSGRGASQKTKPFEVDAPVDGKAKADETYFVTFPYPLVAAFPTLPARQARRAHSSAHPPTT